MTPTPTTGEALAARRGVKRYLLSFDAVELILCLAYAAAGARVPYAWEPSDRMGVPHQTVNAAARRSERPLIQATELTVAGWTA